MRVAIGCNHVPLLFRRFLAGEKSSSKTICAGLGSGGIAVAGKGLGFLCRRTLFKPPSVGSGSVSVPFHINPGLLARYDESSCSLDIFDSAEYFSTLHGWNRPSEHSTYSGTRS